MYGPSGIVELDTVSADMGLAMVVVFQQIQTELATPPLLPSVLRVCAAERRTALSAAICVLQNRAAAVRTYVPYYTLQYSIRYPTMYPTVVPNRRGSCKETATLGPQNLEFRIGLTATPRGMQASPVGGPGPLSRGSE